MSEPSSTFGEPEEWHFDYPWEILKTAYWIWAMSDFKYLPHPDEVMAYPREWITDMKLMMNISGHQTNTRPEQKLVDDLVANEKMREISDMSKYQESGDDPDKPKKKRRNKTILLGVGPAAGQNAGQ